MLLLLIVVIAAGGIFWFDYLNVIDAKSLMSPLLRALGREARTAQPAPEGDFLNLDAERLAVRLEALELRGEELDKKEQDLRNRQGEIEQMAQELEEKQKAQDEREESLAALAKEAESKDRNIEQIVTQLTSMPPQQAAGIISRMADQDVIDVLRKADAIAAAEGSGSLVPVWLMNLPAERSAELFRKMSSRPAAVE